MNFSFDRPQKVMKPSEGNSAEQLELTQDELDLKEAVLNQQDELKTVISRQNSFF